MKNILPIIFVMISMAAWSQENIQAGVYAWRSQNNAVLLDGPADALSNLRVTSNIIAASSEGKISVHVPDTEEQLLIVRSGIVTVHLHDTAYAIGKGSVALILPGDTYHLENNGTDAAEYYLMVYKSKAPADAQRGHSAGGSFVKDWNNIKFKPHDKGGIRQYFERPTTMSKRFEMHVTTLNAGIKSHEPHTHRAEEIVLILDGFTEMQIADKFYKATSGDVIYLSSSILHAIRNEGTASSTYFAFQWE